MAKRIEQFRRYVRGPMVRPLALAAPIFVLLIALPLLRPLRHPSEADVSIDETLRMATVRALMEHHSLALDRAYAALPNTLHLATGTFSAQPPMMALLLTPPAWLITRFGYSFEANHLLISYLLTLIGVTLPVAAASGLIYRMGRLFELPRSWRTLLSIIVVFASGLISYSVVLNAHAPAAALIIASAACLIHVASVERAERRAGWFALAGACAALAGTINPPALIFAPLLACVILTLRFSLGRRVAGVMLYVIGCVPVLALYAAWNIPVTGDLLPGTVHAALRQPPAIPSALNSTTDTDADDESDAPPSNRWLAALRWTAAGLFGTHGVFSHFPAVILGFFGVSAVMHRHWPTSTKALAAATAAAAALIFAALWLTGMQWSEAMFANRWSIIFTPMLLFWVGAWFRRTHAPIVWTLAGMMILFSALVGVAGASDPMPRHGFARYTAAAVLQRLFHRSAATNLR